MNEFADHLRSASVASTALQLLFLFFLSAFSRGMARILFLVRFAGGESRGLEEGGYSFADRCMLSVWSRTPKAAWLYSINAVGINSLILHLVEHEPKV